MELKNIGRAVKPTRPGSQHITLKFLGDPGCPTKRIIDSLEPLGRVFEPFDMKIEEGGAFPNWGRPSVIWLGMFGSEDLKKLAEDIDIKLSKDIGTARESRPFRGHLTLARIRGRSETDRLRDIVERAVSDLQNANYTINVDSFELISSTLTPEGPVYETVCSQVLKG